MAFNLKPLDIQTIRFRIEGTSPLIQHKWSEKAIKMIRDKKLGRKTKDRPNLDSDKEFQDATYTTDEDQYGVPAMAIKSAIITAAHKDIGVEKVLVRKSLFIVCADSNLIVPMITDDPIKREDYVRVGVSGTDLRYRPEFREWAVDIEFQFNADSLRPEDIIALVDRAGFGVGIGEMRPEKGGEYGRFRVSQAHPIEVDSPEK